MKIFHTPRHRLHAPQWYLADGTVRPCPDNPARVDRLVDALAQVPRAELVITDHVDPWPALRGVHTADYLAYLQTIHAIWVAEFGHEGSTFLVRKKALGLWVKTD